MAYAQPEFEEYAPDDYPVVEPTPSHFRRGLGESDQHAWECRVLELVNIERKKGGTCGDLGSFEPSDPVALDGRLRTSSRLHSLDMAEKGYFSHTNLNGESPFDRMKAAGYTYRRAGENIAAGQGSPEAVVTAWMNSDGHCTNILSPHFTHLGVGYIYASGTRYRHYWTQNFGAPATWDDVADHELPADHCNVIDEGVNNDDDEEEEELEEAPTSAPTAKATRGPGQPQLPCIKPHSLPKCGQCLTHDQCAEGWYCCPYMKRCVSSGTMPCPTPVASCVPVCHEHVSGPDGSGCTTCTNADFPKNWAGVTCSGESDDVDDDESEAENDSPSEEEAETSCANIRKKKACKKSSLNCAWNKKTKCSSKAEEESDETTGESTKKCSDFDKKKKKCKRKAGCKFLSKGKRCVDSE